uniref:PAZ domain-containing protein n=1 Tax=Meloidogyne floridensis TaxID=298350 RepID=A0A915NXV7_9BILA
MSTLLDKISKILDCTPENVRYRLNNKSDRDRVLCEIRGKALKTNYLDRNGSKQIIYCDGITTHCSHQLMAFGNLRSPFNICVSAYFYARHRILLKYPYQQCIQYKNLYYPLELLELYSDMEETETDSDSPIIMKNLRTKASSSSESTGTFDIGSTNSNIENSAETSHKVIDHTRRGILWLYVDDKKLWEKHEITLYSSK